MLSGLSAPDLILSSTLDLRYSLSFPTSLLDLEIPQGEEKGQGRLVPMWLPALPLPHVSPISPLQSLRHSTLALNPWGGLNVPPTIYAGNLTVIGEMFGYTIPVDALMVQNWLPGVDSPMLSWYEKTQNLSVVLPASPLWNAVSKVLSHVGSLILDL